MPAVLRPDTQSILSLAAQRERIAVSRDGQPAEGLPMKRVGRRSWMVLVVVLGTATSGAWWLVSTPVLGGAGGRLAGGLAGIAGAGFHRSGAADVPGPAAGRGGNRGRHWPPLGKTEGRRANNAVRTSFNVSWKHFVMSRLNVKNAARVFVTRTNGREHTVRASTPRISRETMAAYPDALCGTTKLGCRIRNALPAVPAPFATA